MEKPCADGGTINRDAGLKRNPMGRMGCPKEIAKVAAFLASPLASFTSGAHIVVDGAFTSRAPF
jgi:3-oxoacyl-[acyl-carrier protein] reductase